MLEGYTSLGYLAAPDDRSAELGLLVTGVDLPPPRAAGQDRHHPRRALAAAAPMLGIGAAWYEREHRGPRRARSRPRAERFERLEETLQIVAQMWSEDDGPYQGKHYRLAETVCVPPPVAAHRRS